MKKYKPIIAPENQKVTMKKSTNKPPTKISEMFEGPDSSLRRTFDEATKPINANKIILDLCAGTGAWSLPYKEAGYDVRVIDLPQDVRLMKLPMEKIYGVLAAPPCTMFCRMRMCQGRPTDEQFLRALSVVDACLRVITMCKPKFWALENPQGYLKNWLGEPNYKFDPFEFGDAWTKRAWVWGNFNSPFKEPLFNNKKVTPLGRLVGGKKNNPSLAMLEHKNNSTRHSITPAGFAQAFYEANK